MQTNSSVVFIEINQSGSIFFTDYTPARYVRNRRQATAIKLCGRTAMRGTGIEPVYRSS